MIFNIIESTYKLLVCQLQGIIGIDFIKTGCVDDTEQEIAKFFFRLFLVTLPQFLLQFRHFLTHFFPHITTVFPIESHVARLVLNAVCLYQCRQSIWNT